jgi:outer membrane protein OmpA-like peptidoglycan-associated protein
MPVFDEFDPVIIVPDIEGLPDFLRGKEVPISSLKKALDFLRGKKSGAKNDTRLCDRNPGMETAQGGKFAGQCCTKFKRDEENCCDWRRLSLQDLRCCTKEEVLLPSNKCFKPQRALQPRPHPKPGPSQTSVTFPPPLPPLGEQKPRVRFGTVSGMTIDGFATDSAQVPARFNKELDHVASLLKLYTDAEIHLEGHTDSSFTEEHNQTLSKKRADSVKKELVKRGVAASRLTPEGFGETQLRFPAESTEDEKAGNRRVEVWYYTPPTKTLAVEFELKFQ